VPPPSGRGTASVPRARPVDVDCDDGGGVDEGAEDGVIVDVDQVHPLKHPDADRLIAALGACKS
jgi:hypothetical protein